MRAPKMSARLMLRSLLVLAVLPRMPLARSLFVSFTAQSHAMTLALRKLLYMPGNKTMAERCSVYGEQADSDTAVATAVAAAAAARTKAVVWILISTLTLVVSLVLIYKIMTSGRENPYAGLQLGELMRGVGAVLAQTAQSISDTRSP